MASLKQLMTLLSYNKVSDEDRAQLVCTWTKGRTTSARELTAAEIADVVRTFQLEETKGKDILRKRLIASIYGWLKKTNKTASPELVKGIACRAAKKDDFNKIPEFKLISLYNMFCHMQKDLNFGQRMVESFILESQSYN